MISFVEGGELCHELTMLSGKLSTISLFTLWPDYCQEPGQCLDFSAIAMVGMSLKQVAHVQKPSIVAELRQFCKDKWARIPPQ